MEDLTMKKIVAGVLVVFLGGFLCTSVLSTFERNGLISDSQAQQQVAGDMPIYMIY